MSTTSQTAAALLAPGRGVFVADEYVGAMLDRLGPQGRGLTLEQYVNLVLAAPDVGDWLSGILLTAETFAKDGHRLAERRSRAVQVGVRMDSELARPAPGQQPGDGLEGARQQLAAHREAGASFVEWRANLTPAEVEAGRSHVEAEVLSRGAAASQGEDILPVVTVAMPDLASQTAEVTQAVTANALGELFTELARTGVSTSEMMLRINMVLPGDRSAADSSPAAVAAATLKVVADSVPLDVPGILLLSGGQHLDQVWANLAAITTLAREQDYPWRFTFAFARPFVAASLEAWRNDADEPTVQREFVESWRRASQPAASRTSTSSSA